MAKLASVGAFHAGALHARNAPGPDERTDPATHRAQRTDALHLVVAVVPAAAVGELAERDGSRRADLGACAAVDAGVALPELLSDIRDHAGRPAAFVQVQRVRPDLLGTHANAAQAQDAAVVVHLNRAVARVVLEIRVQERISDRIHAVFDGQTLQFAVSALGAEHAEVIPAREEQFEDLLAVRLELIGLGVNVHSVRGGSRAGRHELRVALDLDDAHPARPHRRQSLEETHCRNVHVVPPGDLQDRVALLPLTRDTVYVQGYVTHPSIPPSGRVSSSG